MKAPCKLAQCQCQTQVQYILAKKIIPGSWFRAPAQYLVPCGSVTLRPPAHGIPGEKSLNPPSSHSLKISGAPANIETWGPTACGPSSAPHINPDAEFGSCTNCQEESSHHEHLGFLEILQELCGWVPGKSSAVSRWHSTTTPPFPISLRPLPPPTQLSRKPPDNTLAHKPSPPAFGSLCTRGPLP